MALDLSRDHDHVVIADLDIVNPYFRSADSMKELSEAGVKLIASPYVNSNLDVPALPQEMYSLVDDRSLTCVVDVGGDGAWNRVGVEDLHIERPEGAVDGRLDLDLDRTSCEGRRQNDHLHCRRDGSPREIYHEGDRQRGRRLYRDQQLCAGSNGYQSH